MSEDKLSQIERAAQTWLKTKISSSAFWAEKDNPQLDYRLLETMLGVPVGQAESSQSGSFAKSLDLWCAREFVRAGFDEDAVWPRLRAPRVIDPAVAGALAWLASHKGIDGERAAMRFGRADARVMGAVYVKQVDVGLSTWPSGPELLVSTKTMSGSFGNNAANRFEEAYGDVKNLRARYPLAAHGFVFLVRSAILDAGSAFGRVTHMLQSLSQSEDVYDAVGLIVASWKEGDASSVHILNSSEVEVPRELSMEHFYTVLIEKMLYEAPIESHPRARELYNAAVKKGA